LRYTTKRFEPSDLRAPALDHRTVHQAHGKRVPWIRVARGCFGCDLELKLDFMPAEFRDVMKFSAICLVPVSARWLSYRSPMNRRITVVNLEVIFF
jgi:hypothetical protein